MKRRVHITRGIYEAIGGLILVGALVLALLSASGCVPAEQVGEAKAVLAEGDDAVTVLMEEIEGLRTDLETLSAEDPDAAATADALVAMINEKSEAAEQWMTAIDKAHQTVQKSEDGWGLLEGLIGAVSVFVPGAAVGIPIVRRSRRAFEGVVASIEEGGGVKDPEAVRRAMSHYPGLKERVTDIRVARGTKVVAAVHAADLPDHLK